MQFSLVELFGMLTVAGICLGLFAWLGPMVLWIWGVVAYLGAVYFRWIKPWDAVYLGVAVLALFLFVGFPLTLTVRTPSNVNLCRSTLKQIGYALEAYEIMHGEYPPIATYSVTGRPMHSWRTHLLPHLERKDLWELYDFNEPWNGPLNARLQRSAVPVFQCPGDLTSRAGTTSYFAVTMPGAKPGDPFPVIEIHGAGIQFFEPRDISLSEITSLTPRKGALAPRGVHGGSANLHVLWPDGTVEGILSSDLPKRLADFQAAAASVAPSP